jgi:hypothetical protein
MPDCAARINSKYGAAHAPASSFPAVVYANFRPVHFRRTSPFLYLLKQLIWGCQRLIGSMFCRSRSEPVEYRFILLRKF